MLKDKILALLKEEKEHLERWRIRFGKADKAVQDKTKGREFERQLLTKAILDIFHSEERRETEIQNNRYPDPWASCFIHKDKPFERPYSGAYPTGCKTVAYINQKAAAGLLNTTEEELDSFGNKRYAIYYDGPGGVSAVYHHDGSWRIIAIPEEDD